MAFAETLSAQTKHNTVMNEKGNISVHTESIFPIIKKFLYADHEVFLRELVANAVDAIQKLKQLAALGEYEGEVDQLQVQVIVNEKLKTLTIRDQGLGMTAEEIKKYINQVALSGATAFVEQYKDKVQQQQLIGFFGLGFYSAFMVADKAEIITRSYQQDAEPAHWTCEGSTTFELSKAVKKEVGTDVVLHLSKDAEEFLQKDRINAVLRKYCKFLPIAIEFEGEVINNTQPLWTRSPQELKDEDYLNFYKELYPEDPDPLFWIHLNVDYPFNLTGVLYFPQNTNQLIQPQHHIQLYAKQVFITDEVKGILPEFMMLLHGVIDSPDIPLNVSRSSLQADSNVKKIHAHITKKVADKLAERFKQDQKAYEAQWSNIEVFVKYGMLTEDKFYERAQEFTLFKNVANEYATLAAYQDKIRPNQTDKQQNLVMLYATNPTKQDLYIQACQQQGYDVLVLDIPVDIHFVALLERKLDKVQLKGVDTSTVDRLIDKDIKHESVLTEEEQKNLQAIYQNVITDTSTTWSVAALPADALPVTITVPELMRRAYNRHQINTTKASQPPLSLRATVNANHPLAKKILSTTEEDKQHMLAQQVYNLALLSQNMLNGAALTSFIQNTITTISA